MLNCTIPDINMFKEPSGLFTSNESASWGVEMGEEVRRGG